jgi:signal transduction histidine kinase/CheY-like chemotaxis protein
MMYSERALKPMKTLLILAQHPELANAVRTSVDPEMYRVIHHLSLQDAEPLLTSGQLDACILDLDLLDAQSHWMLDALVRRLTRTPILAFASSRQLEWEEEAYIKGIAFVLSKPVRARLLNAVLERLLKAPQAQDSMPNVTLPAPLPPIRPPWPQGIPHPGAIAHRGQPLEVLRDFSSILPHSLQAESMLRQFLLTLREVLDVNRAAIFLRRPLAVFAGHPVEEGRFFRSACAIGLAPGLLEHFQLSFETGIGGYLFQHGKVLRRESAEAMHDIGIQKEFQLLGAQVAIPILDRETLLGIAALDGRVTGEGLSNAELALIFHLLEGVGLAVKNIWLHEQVTSNHTLLANILREISSACVVVSRDLSILHANKTARVCFSKTGRHGGDFEFSDLPSELGTKLYTVLQTGTGMVPFRFQTPGTPQRVFQITIVPFQQQDSALPASALLIADDLTQTEQLQRLEVETANLRLVRTMAERLAHEINNAVMPVDTYRQLMKKEIKDLGPAVKTSEFWNSFGTVMGDSVKRISRRGAQMRILAQDAVLNPQVIPFAPLLQAAYEEAQKHHSASAKLNIPDHEQTLMVSGDDHALTLAISEIFLNALQTEAKELKITVHLQTETDAAGTSWLNLEIRDNGIGFATEALQNAFKPFFRTKVIGLGLGLTVAQKIIEMHQGKIALGNAPENAGAWVRISLPTAK